MDGLVPKSSKDVAPLDDRILFVWEKSIWVSELFKLNLLLILLLMCLEYKCHWSKLLSFHCVKQSVNRLSGGKNSLCNLFFVTGKHEIAILAALICLHYVYTTVVSVNFLNIISLQLILWTILRQNSTRNIYCTHDITLCLPNTKC